MKTTFDRRSLSLTGMISLALALAGVACGDSDDIGASEGNVAAGERVFHAEAGPLPGFSFDTGMLPEGSPAQVQMKLSAGGALKVDAGFEASRTGLAGKPGSGALSLDIHVKVDGNLKVDTALKKYDGDLPGLKDIDIPIGASVAFDPFLLGEGEKAEVKADVPETKLPPIPLGSVPGKLNLTVATGSYLTTSLHGVCVGVSGGKATYTSQARTRGKLILKGTIELELPAPLNKSIALPAIEVPVPEIPATLASSEVAVAGVEDAQQGACDESSMAPQEGEGAGETPAPKEPPSSFTLTIDGKAVTPSRVHHSRTDGIEYIVLYFKAPGYGSAANVMIQAKSSGDGCGEERWAWLDADDGTQAMYYPTKSGAECGLSISSLRPRAKGTFTSWVIKDESDPHQVKATFDVNPFE